MRRYLHNLMVWLDQGGNVFLGGDPDETISSRTGKAARGDFGKVMQTFALPARLFIDIVFWPFEGWGHCSRNIEEDEGANDVLRADK